MHYLLSVCLTTVCFSIVVGDTCSLINWNDGKEVVLPEKNNKAYEKLKPFIGKRFKVKDVTNNYIYDVGICRSAKDEYDTVGVLQFDINGDKRHVIGRYNATQLMNGDDWIMMEYWNGDKYGTHCKQEPRKAVIIIICDEAADDENPGMKILDEMNGKSSDCYYLFELSHRSVCSGKKTTSASLSAGTVFLIIMASVVALYLLLGFLYQRFVLSAKGMEQLPNYSFWQDFGNLQADGCNLVCRSLSSRKLLPYKGIGDEQLEEDLERDDHLLPM